MSIINYKDLPRSPKGKHIDLTSLSPDTKICIDGTIRVKVSDIEEIHEPINESLNENNLNISISENYSNESDTESHDEAIDESLCEKLQIRKLISSPRIESRKKRKLFSKCYKNDYENSSLDFDYKEVESIKENLDNKFRINRSKSLSKLKDSIDLSQVKTRRSIQKEFEAGKLVINSQWSADLNDLYRAVYCSKDFIQADKALLTQLMNDWTQVILQGVPDEVGEQIKSITGFTELLIKSRYKKTIELLNNAEKFLYNDGILVNEDDRVYKSEDIYAYMDLWKVESEKVLKQYSELKHRREKNWEVVIDTLKEENKIVVRKAKKLGPVAVKSRIDVAQLRKKFMNERSTNEDEIFIKKTAVESTTAKETEVPKLDSFGFKTPPTQKAVRNKSVIKSATGSPVHEDTPRPKRIETNSLSESTKSTKSVSFAVPSTDSIKKRKPLRGSATKLLNGEQPSKSRKMNNNE